jgi:GT2 family glycosyltransferase
LTSPDEALVWKGQRVPEAPVVSVCILVVSDHGLIEGCLDTLAGSNPSVEVEVVVVANGLDDAAFSPLRKRDDIVLVRSAVNTGFSGGNNLAATFARGRYLLLLNDDSVVEAGYIDRLMTAIERDPSVAAAGGRVLSPDGTLQEAGSVLWSDGWVAHVGAGLPADSNDYYYVRYADYVSANGLLVDREAWDAVGGLDERYFPAYYEDVDLCLALWDHGYRVAYEPRAQLRHLQSQSTSTTYRNFLLIRNRAQFVAKWSAPLQSFADHPEPIDEPAIEAAVQRAARSIGRVLVLERSADAGEWWLPTVEALAGAGWSVMLSVPVDQQRASAGSSFTDRMIDLGVDVRDERPEDLLSLYGDDLDAVVVVGESTDVAPYLPRPFGSSIPLVGQGEEDRADAVAARVAAVVQQEVESTPPGHAHALERSAATHDPSQEAPNLFGGAAEVRAVLRIAAPTDDGSRRDLKFAEADAGVRREYAEYLEYELARTRAALDKTDDHLRATLRTLEEVGASLVERERYIDSLPSVRVKKWIVSRHPDRGS